MSEYIRVDPENALNAFKSVKKRFKGEQLENELLHLDCVIHRNLGKESTKEERRLVKEVSKMIDSELIKINSEKYYALLA